MSNRGINILSFFDGMSAGQEALRQLGVKVNRYIAIEIDQKSIEITQANFPRTEQKGDILIIQKDLKEWVSKLPRIDLIFSGSPCQGFSKSGKGEGFNHPRSKLFYIFLEIFNEIKNQQKNPNIPFFFENVVMHEKWASIISNALGVTEEEYDSIHYSPTARKRFYWTNLKPPKSIIEKYKQEGGWKTYQDILITKTPPRERVTYRPLFSNTFGKGMEDKIFWKTKTAFSSLATLYKQSSQGRTFYRINAKMPTFVAKDWSVNLGVGSYAFPKAFWVKQNKTNDFNFIKNNKAPNGKPVLWFKMPTHVYKMWSLPKGEYIVFYPDFKEVLDAMGFSINYFDHQSIKSVPDYKKRRAIGNSWHVFIVKILIEWYSRTNGWISGD